MRVKTRDCRISGTCLTWQTFVDDHRRTRFAETAFYPWLRSDDPFFLPIDISHRHGWKLARTGLTTVRWSPEGLHFTARLDLSNPFTRQAVAAIEHGHLRHVSVASAINRKPITLQDAIGKCDLITHAEIRGISLTDQPVIPGTTLTLNGQRHQGNPTWPNRPTDREALQSFLQRIGIDSTPPKPPEPPKRELTVREIYVKQQIAAFDACYDDEPQQPETYRPAIKPTVKTISSDNQRVQGVPAGFWV